jgi:hypothetical protein
MKAETKKDLWGYITVLISCCFAALGMIGTTFSDGYFLLTSIVICSLGPASFILCIHKYDKLLDEAWEETSCQDQN